jgi:DNA-binding transcriptional LysR family regulator
MPRSTLETMPGRSSVKVFELAAPFRNVNTWLFWRKEGHHPNVRALLSLLKAASPLAPTAAMPPLSQRLE